MTAATDLVPELISLAERRQPVTDRAGGAGDTGAVTLVVALVHDAAQAQRIRAALDGLLETSPADRAAASSQQGVLVRGDLTLDLASLRVSLADGSPDGATLSLTHQELRLLRTFLEHSGQVLTREQLMEHAWEFADAGQRRTVDVHVRRLRVKLAASTTRITTLRGFGYRFDPS